MKQLFAVLLAVCLVLAMTACGSGSNTTTTADNSGTSSEYALKTQITSTKKITIRISEDASEIHPSHIALEKCFKEPLETASNGNITVET
mgnify:FL=1